jgi:hypothetical protein
VTIYDEDCVYPFLTGRSIAYKIPFVCWTNLGQVSSFVARVSDHDCICVGVKDTNCTAKAEATGVCAEARAKIRLGKAR